jgi:hypothetical protein
MKIAVLHGINAHKCHTQLHGVMGDHTEQLQGDYRQENIEWKVILSRFHCI